MDLYAYALSEVDPVKRYVEKHYGEVPRMRGVRLMKFMEPGKLGCGGLEDEMYDRHCGEDVIYIHTRCGSAWWGDDDRDANYIACGGKAWEEANSDTFIESCNEEFDGTYRTHYFKAVLGDDYDAICADFKKAIEED